jgi:hypothetical protein
VLGLRHLTAQTPVTARPARFRYPKN